ncbi:hypothetical protein [Burkholderia ambifaria]|uniref:Uncharacterized protein n=1 Tax=Burkholderia ambifaria MEX-5 TaxID=396597 RepID=B1TBB6_9BURK|nr:hypothetical protein [Burkholderia ambifaria]EDT39140.1 hypothetical protein BamMEX5DRAFT_5082 [Burkholderia ambifaria MEX-5]
MDPVSTLNQVLALLRQQVVDRTRRQVNAADSQASARDTVAARAAGSDFGARLHERIDALRTAGIDDEARLARAAIEVVLRHEFDATLANELEFQEMVEWVRKGMMEDERAAALLDDVMREPGHRSGKR